MVRLLVMTALAVAALAASPTTVQAQRYNVHYTLLEAQRPLPKKLVILPVDITVREMSAGGVLEKVPEWTRDASQSIQHAIEESVKPRSDFTIVPMPTLSADEEAFLDEYLASYLVVGLTAQNMTQYGGAAWEHKRKHFDYTLGTGLKFLKEKTGADAAIVAVGDDVVSTAGRKTAFVVLAALGIAIPLGRSVLSLGVVDLGNGDILWQHFDTSVSTDLKDPAGAASMIRGILQAYPGVEARRAAQVK